MTLNLVLVFLMLSLASFFDFRTREIPDWLTYGGLAVAVLLSLVKLSFLNPLMGFLAYFIPSYLFYRLGWWGGGDVKLMMALGAFFGFNNFSAGFAVNLLIAGMVYGILFMLYSYFTNIKKVKRALMGKKGFIKANILTAILIIITAALLPVDIMIKFLLISLTVLLFVLPSLAIFLKTVEDTCMIKSIAPDKVTPGDWIVENIKIGRTHIHKSGRGLNEKEINNIKKLYRKGLIDKVMIKLGVPFAPAFLFAFLLTLAISNPVMFLWNFL